MATLINKIIRIAQTAQEYKQHSKTLFGLKEFRSFLNFKHGDLGDKVLSDLYDISKRQQTEEVGTIFENIASSGVLQLFVLRQVSERDMYVAGHQLVNQASQKLDALKRAGMVIVSPEEVVKFVLSLGEQAKNAEFWANFSTKSKELAACVKAVLSKGYNQPVAGQSHLEAFVQSLMDRE